MLRNMRTLSPRSAALLLLLAVQAAAHLTWTDGSSDPRTAVVLPSFGDGELHVSVLYEQESSADKPEVETTTDLFTVGEPMMKDGPNGYTNITYTFSFTGGVGVADYEIVGKDDSLQGKVIAAGFVIKNDGKIVSGDDGAGVEVGQEGETMYEVEAVGVDGNSVDVSGTKVIPRPGSGSVYYKEIDEGKTGFTEDKFTLAINKYRVGTGAIVLSFEAVDIEYEGEFFETVLHVTQSTTPTPPCVVEGAELVSEEGVVEASMFNILSPPRSTPVSEIVLTVGGKTTPSDLPVSSLVPPTSTIVFSDVTGTGPASITCDGQDAVVIEDGVVVEDGLTVTSSGNASEPLAVDSVVADLPTSETLSVVISVIRVIDSDPSVLTKSDALALVNEFCTVILGSDCVIVSITRGSAVVEMAGLASDPSASQKALKKSFDKCSFQEATGYNCEKVQLEGVRATNAVAATAGAAGIATWTIILIACVGALGLVLLVALTLWAVHRRASLNEESSYSSSGPMGVPDPSDLLYEQSIVRDVYGRGEKGGPTAQDAQKSEQLAAMRDEFPRPPSSGSGSSRGRASVDASSTYSV